MKIFTTHPDPTIGSLLDQKIGYICKQFNFISEVVYLNEIMSNEIRFAVNEYDSIRDA